MAFRMHPAAAESDSSMNPSNTNCGVCGQYALTEDSIHEFAGGLSDRLVCQACGAHRVM